MKKQESKNTKKDTQGIKTEEQAKINNARMHAHRKTVFVMHKNICTYITINMKEYIFIFLILKFKATTLKENLNERFPTLNVNHI